MKKLLLLILITLVSSNAFAELRVIAINCKAVIKKDDSGSSIIKGQIKLQKI